MDALHYALLGVGGGTAYVLMGQGIVLIYRGSGLLNFAQGGIALIAAHIFYSLRDSSGLATPIALVATLAVAGAIGASMQLVVLHQLREASELVRLIATLGLLTLIQGIGVVLWGDSAVPVIGMFPERVVDLGSGLTIGSDRLMLLGVAVVLTTVLWWTYTRTRFGLATSAVAENAQSLAVLGWSPGTIATANWVLGSMLAGLAGVLLAPIAGMSVSVLILAVIPGLAAALVGGFSSFWWTLVGGLAIGVLQAEGVRYVETPGLSQSIPFLVIVGVVMLRGRALPTRGEVVTRVVRVGQGTVRLPVVILGMVVGGVLLGTVSDSWQLALTASSLGSIVALSLVLITGYAGQVSLAQLAIAGVGALAAANASSRWGLPFLLCVLFGAAVASVVGLVVALPALRTRGLQLAVVTIGLGMVVEALILRNSTLGGGYTGLTVEAPTLFGWSIDSLMYPARFTGFVLVSFVLLAIAVANVRRGPSGRRLLALRTNERASVCAGISVFGAKLYAFGLGAGIGGFAGAVGAFQFPRLDVAQYTTLGSITLLIQTMIGGIGHMGGAFVGGLASPGGVVADVLSNVGDSWTDSVILISGVVVLVNLVFYPDGVARSFAETLTPLIDKASSHLPWRRKPAGVLSDSPGEHVTPDAGRRLTVQGLTVRFGGVVAVDDVSLTVGPGEVLGLIGPNGAGKTTIIDAISGLVPSTGKVELDGRDIGRLSARRRALSGIGRTFQSLELFDDLTVLDNVRIAAEARSRWCYVRDLVHPRSGELPPVAQAAIRELDLVDVLEVAPERLPAGQRGLVGVARMLAIAPGVVLLDEPASGLNDAERVEMVALIKSLAQRWGLAVLLVEHDVNLVREVSERIVALALGTVIAEGAPDEVLADPQVVAVYLGRELEDHPVSAGHA